MAPVGLWLTGAGGVYMGILAGFRLKSLLARAKLPNAGQQLPLVEGYLMKRSWLLSLALSLFAGPAIGAMITDADVGQVVRIVDVGIYHLWFGTTENAPPIDWEAELRFRENGVPTDTFGFHIDDIDPGTFAPFTIDENNAATYGLDWVGLADYLLNDVTADEDQAMWYEEATAAGALGTSTFGPGWVLHGSDAHYRETVLDRIEISLYEWRNYNLGRVMFGFDVGIYALITNGAPLPEPCFVALVLPVLFWKVRRK